MKLSRDTIKPHIQYFSERNLIRRVEDGYRLTNLGEIALEKINELESFVELNEKHGEFFTTHDLDSMPEDLRNKIHLLKACTVFKKDDPYEIRGDWFETARKSKWLKVLSPILYPELLRLYPVLSTGKRVEIITTEEIFHKGKNEYPDLAKQCIETSKFYICSEAKLFLWVSDKQLTLFLSRDGMLDMINVVICNSKEGIEWGTKLFDSYLEGSARITEL